MKTASLLGGLFLWSVCAQAGHWYKELRPGVTRAEIRQKAGAPTSTSLDTEIYRQSKGYIELRYEKGVLKQAEHYNPPGGGISRNLYSNEGETSATDLDARRAYLKNAQFAILPNFSGHWGRTSKYDGKFYQVDGNYLVIEAIIPFGWPEGWFGDKAAKVMLVKPDGTEEALYRAADHWEELKPPGLSSAQIKQRTLRLQEMGRGSGAWSASEFFEQIAERPHKVEPAAKPPIEFLVEEESFVPFWDRQPSGINESVQEFSMLGVFGTGDDQMGSGLDYRLFYLKDGLLTTIHPYGTDRLEVVNINQPGRRKLTLDEWLAKNPVLPTAEKVQK